MIYILRYRVPNADTILDFRTEGYRLRPAKRRQPWTSKKSTESQNW